MKTEMVLQKNLIKGFRPSSSMEMELSFEMQQSSVVTSNCFPNTSRKFYNAFVATYLWIHQCTPQFIQRESGLSAPTVRDLLFHWREILQLENENEDILHGLMGSNSHFVEIDECALTGKRKAKRGPCHGKRQKKDGPI